MASLINKMLKLLSFIFYFLLDAERYKTLVAPGPTVVICDEAHHPSNNDSKGIHAALDKINTKRRIILTGLPLDNNFEYRCISLLPNNY